MAALASNYLASARESRYLRGLLSQHLGPDRLLEDELVDAVLNDRDFRALCDWFDTQPFGQALVAKQLGTLAPAFAGTVRNDARERAYWDTVLTDPQFDPIWKRANEELKTAPEIVRTSLLSRIFSLLGRLKPSSESSPESPRAANAIAAIIVAAATAAGTHYILPPRTPDAPTYDKQLAALQAQNNKQQQLIDRYKGTLDAVAKKLSELSSTVTPVSPALSVDPTETNKRLSDIAAAIRDFKGISFPSRMTVDVPDNVVTTVKITDLPLGLTNSLKETKNTINSELGPTPAATAKTPDSDLKTYMRTIRDDSTRTASLIDSSIGQRIGTIASIQANARGFFTRIDPTSRTCGITVTPTVIAADYAQVKVSGLSPCNKDTGPPDAAKAGSTIPFTVTRARTVIPDTDLQISIDAITNRRLWPLPRTTSFLHKAVSFNIYGYHGN